MKFSPGAIWFVLWPLAAVAEPAASDKSAYSLANPTPANLLRELATDRPDVTESPFTVDAGHAQLEMDFANFTRHRLTGSSATTWGVAPFNLRLGLRENLEAGIFVSPYARVSEAPAGGTRTVRTGFGDTTLRTKLNFWGNDGGPTAFGLIADLTLPTAASGMGNAKVEGALLLPVSLELAGGWEASAMTVAEFRHRETGGAEVVWMNSASFGHDLTKDVSGYVELTSTVGDGTHVATFDVGGTWKVDANLQLDCGANFGLTRSADDLLVFAGISRRF